MGRGALHGCMAASLSAFLNVWNIEKSLEFYEALGFRVDARHTDEGTLAYADLSLDGAELGLGNIHWNDDAGFRAWVGTPLGAGVVVYVTVPDVDAVHARAVRVGAVIEAPLEDRAYGRVFTLNDPDGYTLTFLQEAKKPPRRTTRKPAARQGAAKRKASARRKVGAKRRR